MPFSDTSKLFYDGEVEIKYFDKAHRYFRRIKLADGTWSDSSSVRGVTTIMDAVLEKKGLMTWPMGLALQELFGFYDFTNENGEHLFGFSKGKGTMWNTAAWGSQADALPLIQSASKAWQRKKKTGADVGSLVHDAIEQYVKGTPFDLTLEKYTSGMEEPIDVEKATEELKMAQVAFERFKQWWKEINPTLVGIEEMVYSRQLDFAGTYDGLLEIDGKIILADWKTSNASTSKEAAAPQGVYYSYFIQSGAYALALEEMTGVLVDDLLIVSSRKDGGFDTVAASDLGLTVRDCKHWWEAVYKCYLYATKAKKALINNVKENV